MSEKQKPKRENTPIGECAWAHILTPKPPFKDEQGHVKGEPKYQLDVIFDPKSPEWSPFVKTYSDLLKSLPEQTDKRSGEKIKKQSPFKRELDEKDEPTGRIYVTFKTGEKFKPQVFDAHGKPWPEGVLIGNGSKVRVNYVPNTYIGFGGGVNFYLNAVQVVELVEYKSQTASAYGFNETPAEPSKGEQPQDDIPF